MRKIPDSPDFRDLSVPRSGLKGTSHEVSMPYAYHRSQSGEIVLKRNGSCTVSRHAPGSRIAFVHDNAWVILHGGAETVLPRGREMHRRMVEGNFGAAASTLCFFDLEVDEVSDEILDEVNRALVQPGYANGLSDRIASLRLSANSLPECS